LRFVSLDGDFLNAIPATYLMSNCLASEVNSGDKGCGSRVINADGLTSGQPNTWTKMKLALSL
jgi:hypothetical protein